MNFFGGNIMKLKFRAEPKDVMIFIIFAVFLLYLVAIAVLNLHSFTTEAHLSTTSPAAILLARISSIILILLIHFTYIIISKK